MQTTFALAALAAVAYAAPRPQGVTQNIPPSSPPPAGCSTSYSGEFQLQAVNFALAGKRGLEKRTCNSEGTLTVKSLTDGVLLDSKARTGYIAANYQFQFDGPAQTGAIYTSGFSVCSNGSLALGGSAVFYQCLSGGFYNLYDRNWAAQCNPILLDVLPCATATTNQASQKPDGQVQATTAVPISQIGDGQVQASSAVPISQIGDGQLQATSAVPLPTTPAAPISQISDGQLQATTAVPVPTTPAAPISQISDGQLQATTAVPVPTTPVAPISQISDGQLQATTAVPPFSSVVPSSVATTAAPVPVTSGNPGGIIITASSFAPTSILTSIPVPVSTGTVVVPSNGTTTFVPPTVTPNPTSTPASTPNGAGAIKMVGSQFAAIIIAVVALTLL